MTIHQPVDEHSLEELLSRPDQATVDALAALGGDIIVLGAGGKMGPTLSIMARRALDTAGGSNTQRKVMAVSRFGKGNVAAQLQRAGVEVFRADLSDAAQTRTLPVAENVIWMAGQKFGTSGDPVTTWTHNVVASTYAAERFAGARIVCFSTGNVYGASAVASGGSVESDILRPEGEYAASCIGRERVFESISRRTNSPLLLFRLFYACDLRYGVVTDIALRILNGESISLATPSANIIWQGDANRLALRALTVARLPAVALNVTGPCVPIREIADRLAARMGKKALFTGSEGSEALIANTSVLNETLPYSALPLDTLLDWTVSWVQSGRPLLNRPTKYEVRDGRF